MSNSQAQFLFFCFFLNRKFAHFIDALQLLYILPYYVENTENTSYFVKPKTDIESKDELCFTQWTLFP
jgi:hypothetical protein